MTKTVELELNGTELNYLLNLVEDNIREGNYWGNKEQFHKMQSRVLDKINEINDELILSKIRGSL